MKKIISPAALNSLAEALTNIYWYKNDLKRFLMGVINDPYILSNLDWYDYKRNIVKRLVDIITRNQEKYKNEIIELMLAVSDMKDFSHLSNLEDGDLKVKRAIESVTALRSHLTTYKQLLKEQEQIEQNKIKYEETVIKTKGITEKLIDLKEKFNQLTYSDDKTRRGYILQDLLKELFGLFDLDPKASFSIFAEQIDGSFTFDNIDYILEARWREKPADRFDLDAFSMKVSRKLDNTLGLFVSINGFQKTAIETFSQNRSVIILMDGMDLIAVLEERIDLKTLLLRKRRHAAQTGKIYISVNEILCD